MRIKDIQWLLVLCGDNENYDTEFTRCELTNTMADCWRCLITDSDGVEFEADINRHDAVNIMNGDYEDT